MAVHFGIKGGAGRQRVGRIKMVAPAEHADRAVLQTDLHMAVQNEGPLVVARVVELTAKTCGAVTQLEAGCRSRAAVRMVVRMWP